MTDHPYEKAIEETAKATGKALDIVKDASESIADVYGIVIGDHVHHARIRRLDKMARRTKEILEERDVSEKLEVSEDIGIPLLEAAQRESREEMQELWAQLLANAQDPARSRDVRPQLIRALRGLQPLDVVVMKNLDLKMGRFKTLELLAANIPDTRDTAINVALSNLESIGCVMNASNSKDHYGLTPLGIELIRACAT